MKVLMELMSDTIFGNGISVPGGEDISVLCDDKGFPYYKGGTLKGIFREELKRYLSWKGVGGAEAEETIAKLLGAAGNDTDDPGKLTFSDFVLPDKVRAAILSEVGDNSSKITETLTGTRTFTAIDDTGTVKEGSLRVARYVNKGLIFEGTVSCRDENEPLVSEVLSMVKWIGTMRNRGFGKVRFSVV